MSTAKKETTGGTLLVALVLCIVCSVIVAGAAVSLKPVQTSNKQLDRKKNILSAAGMFAPGEHGAAEVEELFGRFTVRMVDLDTGEYLSEQELARPELNPDRYDQIKAAKDREAVRGAAGDGRHRQHQAPRESRPGLPARGRGAAREDRAADPRLRAVEHAVRLPGAGGRRQHRGRSRLLRPEGNARAGRRSRQPEVEGAVARQDSVR